MTTRDPVAVFLGMGLKWSWGGAGVVPYAPSLRRAQFVGDVRLQLAALHSTAPMGSRSDACDTHPKMGVALGCGFPSLRTPVPPQADQRFHARPSPTVELESSEACATCSRRKWN